MSTDHRKLFPVYVWEVPVRVWHWLMVPAMLVLFVTGYFIGAPLPSVGGEASDNFWFGYIRFAHFASAYVFAITLVLRVVWGFFGNRFSREILAVPVSMFSAKWWDGLIDQTKYYLFLKRHARPWQGHNPLAMAAMFWGYIVPSVFMLLSGFALYGEGLGMDSWAYQWVSSWFLPMFGQSMNVHTLHRLCAWALVVFAGLHFYMVLREDICSDETVMSTMANGWRVSKK